LRVLGVERRTLPGALAGTDVTVLAAPVLATGRRELLSVLREQAISRTVHRFGHLPADGLRPSRRWNARGPWH
ncbi:MAG TPA: hypothetical protein VIR58_03330, partial [Acidimicrobiales bacterium]